MFTSTLAGSKHLLDEKEERKHLRKISPNTRFLGISRKAFSYSPRSVRGSHVPPRHIAQSFFSLQFKLLELLLQAGAKDGAGGRTDSKKRMPQLFCPLLFSSYEVLCLFAGGIM